MNAKTAIPTLALLLTFLPAAALEAQRVLWSAPRGASAIPEDPTEAPFSVELADDFEAWGDVTNVELDGAACTGCSAPAAKSVAVRFWSWTAADGPGDLVAEYFLQAGDDHLKIDAAAPSSIAVRLATPFAARGRYFVSLQIEFAGIGAWSWWTAADAPRLSPAWVRARDGAWGPAERTNDLAFALSTTPWDDVDFALGCGQLEVETPMAPGLEASWRATDVAALDRDRAWAIGVAKAEAGPRPLFFERRRGIWRTVDLPVGDDVELRAIEVVSAKEVWVVGSFLFQPGPAAEVRQPLALRYLPDASRWEVLATPLLLEGEALFTDLVGRADGEVWIVGSSTQTVDGAARRVARLWSHDGTTFKDLTIEDAIGGGDEELTAIAGVGTETWMVGGGTDPAARSQAVVLRWNGASAERVAVPGIESFARIHSVAAAEGEVWIGGRSRTEDPVLLHLDGRVWTESSSRVGGDALAARPKRGFATAGPALASTVGTEWKPEPDGGLRANAIAAPATCALFVAGRFETSLGDRGAFYRLAPRGFGDGFESSGFEAWSEAVGASGAR